MERVGFWGASCAGVGYYIAANVSQHYKIIILGSMLLAVLLYEVIAGKP